MTTDVDILVVGAGPAGLSAGIVFARNGFQTVVIDKKQFPIDKVCGEGILPPGVDRLERLGVRKHIHPEDYFRFDGIYYRSPGGQEAVAEFHHGPAWGISRLALSRAFMSSAGKHDCLDIRPGIKAGEFRRQSGRIFIDTGEELFSCRLLVGADGINSKVRRWAGLEGPAPKIRRWGIRRHFSRQPWSKYAEIHWGRGVEAYITPCGKNCVGVTFLISLERIPEYSPGKQLMTSLIDSFPDIQIKLVGVDAIDEPLAVGPMQRSVKSTIADGVLLIGDSSGYLDAITGEGISLALAQAIQLEQTVIPAMKHKTKGANLLATRDLSEYARVHENLIRPYLRKTKLVLLLVRFPRLVDPVTAALGKWPKLFQRLIS